MKKILGWFFWIGVIGSMVYFYTTKPQIRECCSVCRKRLADLFDQMHSGCCQHHQEKENEV
jgi:hypothetical protein